MTDTINTKLITVTRTGTHLNGKTNKVALTGNWLLDIGFTIGLPVKVMPVTNGMDFILICDDISIYTKGYLNICDEVATSSPNAKLIHVVQISYKKRDSYPAVMTTGNFIDRCGLSFGDTCVVKYSYGKIQVRKVDLNKFGFSDNEHTRICSFNSSLKPYEKIEIRLSEKWLSSYGFENEVFILATAESGSITFELKSGNIESYKEMVKMARAKRLTLIQVKKGGKGNPYIAIPHTLLKKAEIFIDDIFTVQSTYGHIKLYKLDVTKMF